MKCGAPIKDKETKFLYILILILIFYRRVGRGQDVENVKAAGRMPLTETAARARSVETSVVVTVLRPANACPRDVEPEDWKRARSSWVSRFGALRADCCMFVVAFDALSDYLVGLVLSI